LTKQRKASVARTFGVRALAGLLAVAAVLAVSADPAAAGEEGGVADPASLAEEQFGALDVREMERYLRPFERDGGDGAGFDLRGAVADLIRGKSPLSASGVLEDLLRAAGGELVTNLRLLGQLVILAVGCGLLQNLGTALGGDGAGKVAHGACYLAVAALALGGFAVAVGTARGVVGDLSGFMIASLPILLALLASTGAWACAGLFQPVVVVAAHVVGFVVTGIVLPVLFTAATVDIASGFTEAFSLAGLGRMLRQGCVMVLGVLVAGFVGLMIAVGATGAVADGVGLKGAKFLSSTFVPVIGKLFADAVDVVASSTLLLKSAVGVAGMIAIFLIVAYPLVKLVVLVFVYRAASVLVQPVGGQRIAACLESMSSSLALVAVSIGAVALAFFVTVTAMVGAGAAAAMLR